MRRQLVSLLMVVCIFVASGNVMGDESALLIVAADSRAAQQLPAIPATARVQILIQAADESIDCINARAVSLRNATHFVYDSTRESLTVSLYRERLQNQGAVVIDLSTDRATPLRRFPPKARVNCEYQASCENTAVHFWRCIDFDEPKPCCNFFACVQ